MGRMLLVGVVPLLGGCYFYGRDYDVSPRERRVVRSEVTREEARPAEQSLDERAPQQSAPEAAKTKTETVERVYYVRDTPSYYVYYDYYPSWHWGWGGGWGLGWGWSSYYYPRYSYCYPRWGFGWGGGGGAYLRLR